VLRTEDAQSHQRYKLMATIRNISSKGDGAKSSDRDAMLADALEVISAAEDCFYVQGSDNTDPEILMLEALHSVEQELNMFSSMVESPSCTLRWQELWRASARVKLARTLAEFRRTHGACKPQKATEGGAS
jgi:hypothetical protein